jgi:hypothetical protein
MQHTVATAHYKVTSQCQLCLVSDYSAPSAAMHRPSHLTWTLLLSLQVLIAIDAASDQPHSGENYSCVGADATAPTRSGAAGAAAAAAAVEQQRCAAALCPSRAGASSDGGAKNAVRFAE